MRPLLSFAVCFTSAIALVTRAASFSEILPKTLEHDRRWYSAGIQAELSSLLSSTAAVLSPLDDAFIESTERWMSNVQPKVQLSVQVGTEKDVATVVSSHQATPNERSTNTFDLHLTWLSIRVQYANSRNLSFYAVSRGHALTSSVGYFNGIEIDMRKLGGIQIASDNKTVHLQGGVYSYNVIRDLWAQGFVTASGTGDCVSVIGPALGGGHGLQEGQHGLTMDHFVNLNVVLADGTAATVNEATNPDLWWAMRGAGHNFGIVTSWDAKIWEDNFKTYFVRQYVFNGSALEPLFEEVNRWGWDGSLDPVWLVGFGVFAMDMDVSKTEPIISWTFVYDGPKEDAMSRLAPFDALGPVLVQDNTTTYRDINNLLGGAIDGPLCEPNKTHIVGTANLQNYNVTAERAIYDLYAEKIRQHPELGGTHVLHQGYSVAGVASFPDEDSAYAQRDEHLLMYFDVRLDTSDDPLIEFAEEWRDQTVALLNEGQPDRMPSTYVNYASGKESLESRYGYDSWRLERLRALKKEYDPRNKFAWYNPIIPIA